MRTLVWALLCAAILFMLPAAPGAAPLDQRLAAVGQAIAEADEMYSSAKKGHLPSLDAINRLHARLALARRLYAEAKGAAENGQRFEAGARLDAAEFLAREVYEASKH